MSSTAIELAPFQSAIRPRQRVWLTALCLALTDLAANGVAGAIALLTCSMVWHPGVYRIAEHAALGCSVVAAFAAFGLYPLVAISPVQEFRRILLGSGIVYVVVGGTRILAGGDARYLLTLLVFTWILTILTVLMGRAVVRTACSQYSWWGIQTVIFGSGASARSTFRFLQRHLRVGLKVVAVFDEKPIEWPELEAGNIPHGNIQTGLDFAAKSGIDHAIIAVSGAASDALQDILRYEAHGFKHLLVVPDL